MRVTGDQKLAVLFSLPVKLIKETILSATQVAVKEFSSISVSRE